MTAFRHTLFCALLLLSLSAWSQNGATASASTVPPNAPLTVDDALRFAKANEPQFRSAVAEAGIAHGDKVQARAALLPSVAYTTGIIYTTPNGTLTGAYVGANGPHEYLSQGVVHESLSFAGVADLRRTQALEALGKARAEIALRGLVATVVQSYYAVIVSDSKYRNAQLAAQEAENFVQLSQKLQNGGEVAQSDVIKAQLQANDRQRDVQETQLAAEQAKLGLAVLIFPDFNPDYQLVNDLDKTPALPDFPQVQQLAATNNPEINAAMAAFKASQYEVSAAVGARIPSLSFDYLYGIDANQYATYTPDHIKNLGSQVVATLSIPIFDWGSLESKIKQAHLQRDVAKVQLSATQREALANLRLFYREAQTARNQIELLKHSADLAADSLRLTTLRYQGGEATALEVVDAQNTLVLARDNFDDATARYRVAIANLQTLTGSF